jgi:hypothetical protein
LAGKKLRNEDEAMPAPRPISSTFKLTFISVLVLTVLSSVIVVYLASLPNPTEEQKRLVEVFASSWKMGFGAVVGLIGGKTL